MNNFLWVEEGFYLNINFLITVPTLIEQIQLVSGVGLKLISDDTVK
jgi:hypothetical protein